MPVSLELLYKTFLHYCYLSFVIWIRIIWYIIYLYYIRKKKQNLNMISRIFMLKHDELKQYICILLYLIFYKYRVNSPGLFLIISRFVLWCRMSQPILIGGLLAHLNRGSSASELKYAYMYATGLLLNILANILLFHYSQVELSYCGMKMRVACCSLIYRKVRQCEKKMNYPRGYHACRYINWGVI